MMMETNMDEAITKCLKIINSCTTCAHIQTTKKLLGKFHDMYSDTNEYNELYSILIAKMVELKCNNDD